MASASSYDPLAFIYNTHWAQPERLMLPLDRFILPELDPGAEILDLCCGTGQTAAMLTEHGYEVTGIDGSESMLVFARENAPDADFITGDVRTFSMPGRFDAVVSQYDSLNHILSVEELLTVFRNVHAALVPGGVFLFDLNTEEGYLQRWRATSIGHVEDDHAYITHPAYDREDADGLVQRGDVLPEGWSLGEDGRNAPGTLPFGGGGPGLLGGRRFQRPEGLWRRE